MKKLPSNLDYIGPLVETGRVDLDAVDDQGCTPLMLLAQQSNSHHRPYGIVTFLLEKGARVDIRNSEGKTALHLAMEKGAWRIMEEIVSGDPGARDLITHEERRALLKPNKILGQEIVDKMIECLVREADGPMRAASFVPPSSSMSFFN